MEKDIEIPFGAFDSELVGFEYTIPEGYEAEIKDDKVIIKKKEYEDERIRKELVEYLKENIEKSPYRNEDCETEVDRLTRYIAWLEKQGEQKPIDKVESKFKVGNWYQCTKDFFGKGVTFDKNTAYYCAKEGCLQCEYGCHIAIVKDLYDNFKLWTIQDAKDGDVLANKYGAIFINASSSKGGGTLDCYCYLSVQNEFCVEEHKTGSWFYKDEIKPATKEQRDLLFQKMKEAGYEWDAEKKKPKKIEQEPYPETLDKAIELYYYSYGNGKRGFDNLSLEKFKDIVKTFVDDYGMQNHAWSEEDEDKAMIGTIISDLKRHGGCGEDCSYQKEIDWLKSLKDRVLPQPKQEWSEEDEERLSDAIFFVREYQIPTRDKRLLNAAKETEDWLRNFQDKVQPQNTWKPSDEQLRELQTVSTGRGWFNKEILKELLEQLKKLRED